MNSQIRGGSPIPARQAAVDQVAVADLKRWLVDGKELALIDVREHGEFGEGHLFFAISVPYSVLEWRVRQLVPRLGTRIVLYDADCGHVARKAVWRLTHVGYQSVHVLAGGLTAWRHAGHGVFAGVNVPSKAFGELVEHQYKTPKVTAVELAAMQQNGADLVVLDGRPIHEYRKMSIPGAVCCPNGELALRASALVKSPATTIVVNCAGRTRSIVGAQTLIDMGTPNQVKALENGTQGWTLADLTLEHGAQRAYPDELAQADLKGKQRAAADFSLKNHLQTVPWSDVQPWLQQPDRTTFLCDIRTPEEFALGTINSAIHAPGGQLIQATDQYLGTWKARVVVFDTEGVRAVYVAVWLKRMGWEVYVLADGAAQLAAQQARQPLAPDSIGTKEPVVDLTKMDANDLVRMGMHNQVMIDLRPSMRYRKAHIRNSVWSIRPRLTELDLAQESRPVLIVDNPLIAMLAAGDLAERGIQVRGYFVWDESRLGTLQLEHSPKHPPDKECVDYLFFVHDRHDGNKAAARRYLAWEMDLLEHLDAEELASINKNL